MHLLYDLGVVVPASFVLPGVFVPGLEPAAIAEMEMAPPFPPARKSTMDPARTW